MVGQFGNRWGSNFRWRSTLFCVTSVLLLAACSPAPTDDGVQTLDTAVDTGVLDAASKDTLADATAPGDSDGLDGSDASSSDITGTDAANCVGGPRCPCTNDSECDAGQCLETATGRICAAPCDSSSGCLATENCALVGAGSDVVKFCVPRWVSTCAPCGQNADCNFPGAGGGVLCAPLGNLGSFCTSNCTGDGDCPPTFTCTAGVCHPVTDTCTCSAWAVSHNATAQCFNENASGKCSAPLTCAVQGPWPTCLADVATSETCNGKDDNCNGLTDDAAGPSCDDDDACTLDACSGGICQHLKNIVCGDGLCAAACGENQLLCPIDCHKCGDNVCSPGEGPNTCAEDCCGGCGDGKCVGYACGENPITCVQDCSKPCGDGICDNGENPGNCAMDCKKQGCGNNVCEPTDGGPTGCPKDCAATCGNCVCEKSESFDTCPNDCGYCGDGTCSICGGLGEDPMTCIADCGDLATVGCTSQAWSLFCLDDSPCTDDVCQTGKGCVHLAAVAPCTDGNACTNGDVCTNGVCAPGEQIVCNDGNPCTTDSCDPTTGCTTTNADGVPCSDGNACTVGDLCAGGGCASGKAPDCDDASVCTDDACANGKCLHLANAATCTDDNACTTGETCSNGGCYGAKVVKCDDGNLCTADACELATGCTTADLNGASCSDGDACTSADVCNEGACAPGPLVQCDDGNTCTSDACDGGGCKHTPLVTVCFDGNVCTQNEGCIKGACSGGQIVNCDDGNGCTADSCDATEGCGHTPLNATSCDDGDTCTIGDACSGGLCGMGKPLNCSDGNPCTADVCHLGGCVSLAFPATCTDSNACTSGDACTDGTCVGVDISCDDGNPCTADGCKASSGCVHGALGGSSCDDGDPCTIGDTCSTGVCNAGAPLSCNDSNVCTDDACQGGTCAHTANSAACSDNNACTTGDGCVDKQCVGVDISCDDGNPCTADGCKASSGCVHGALGGSSCDDGDPCTIGDTCSTGVCNAGAPLSCNDSNVCTDDACQGGTCAHTANSAACSDNNACTTGDGCVDKQCVGADISCDDGNPCTVDGCTTANGCQHVPQSALSCDDGDPCTTGDMCAGVTCMSGTPLNCNDGNVCTDDGCSGGNCVHLPNDATCTDGNVCTDDGCKNGGCVYVANVALCSDGNACTVGDLCAAGACGGTANPCDDQNPCTDNQCTPGSGCLNPSNTLPCADGNACTSGDTCSGGTCSGAATNCDDGTLCTIDNCSPTTGCAHPKITCDPNATCGAATGCVCNTGWYGDGESCTPLVIAMVPSSGALAPNFAPSVASYAVDVGETTASATLSVTVATGATLTVNGSNLASGQATAAMAPGLGTTSWTVVVTHGSAIATYTVNLARGAYLKASNTAASHQFGGSIALDNNTLLVGATGEASCSSGVNGNQTQDATNCANVGAVYVFVRTGLVWSQQAYLKPSNSASGFLFGKSVAISGDTAVIGAPAESSCAIGVGGGQTQNPGTCGSSGAVYVFTRSGTTWTQQAYLKASNPASFNGFGSSVGVSGNTAIVGAPFASGCLPGVGADQSQSGCAGSGSAYIFLRSGTTWAQQAFVRGSNVNLWGGTNWRSMYFGTSAAISNDTVIVGAPGESGCDTGVNGNQTQQLGYLGFGSCQGFGASYVLTRSGTTWTQQSYLKSTVHTLGQAVALNVDTAVVGQSSSQSPVVYTRAIGWSEQAKVSGGGTAYNVALAGDSLLVGQTTDSSCTVGLNSIPSGACSNAGAARFYTRSGTAWSQVAYVKALNTAAGNAFGSSTAVGPGILAIGAPSESSCATGIGGDQTQGGCSGAGAVYVYQ